MKYLLSVDGGGTKTEFCLADQEGNILDSFVTGSTNFKSVGIEICYNHLQEGMAYLKKAHKIDTSNISISVLGISGCDSQSDYDVIHEQIRRLGLSKEQIHLCNDGVLAFYARASAPGVVVIAGTGSIVIGVDQSGAITRSGGWGYNISDIGSGYWIGNEILRTTLLYCDGCYPYTPLFDRIKQYFKIADYADLPFKITEISDNFEVAKLAFEVVKAAEQGSDLACKILRMGAVHLAQQVNSVYRRMDPVKEETFNIVFSGGVLKSQLYQNMLTEEIRRHVRHPLLEYLVQIKQPSFGGIRLAQRLRQQ